MMLLNIEYIPGKRIEALGLVKGTTVYSKSFGKDFMAGMKTLVGGEIEGYTDLLRRAARLPPSVWWTRQRRWERTRW